MKLNLNEIDAKILSHLQENTEITYKELSEKEDLSKRVIQTRIKKLRDKGYLKFVVADRKDPEDLKCADARSFVSGHFQEKISSFSISYNQQDCHQHLWRLMKICFSGDFCDMSSKERLDLLSFYEELTDLMAEFYKYAEVKE